MAVDQPARDAGRARDLLDRRVLHAALVEQRAGDLDEVALARSGARFASACERKCDSRSQRWLGCRVRGGEGAPPKVPRLQRRVLNAIRAFTSPLLPDDYLELINPLWSTRELRGKIESIDAETDDAATVTIRPGYEWEGHEPGQYLRIGLDIKGRRHWRAYSLTSDPGAPTASSRSRSRTSTRAWSRPTSCGAGGRARIVVAGRRRGRVRAPRRAAREAPVHQRRQRDHADHEHAAQPRAPATRSNDVVLIHSARNAGRRDLRRAAARAGEAERRIPPARAADRRDGALRRPPAPRRAVPGLEGARGVPLRAGRACSTRSTSTGTSTPTATACTWSASSRSSARPRRARAGRSSSSRATARRTPTARSRSSWPARTRGSTLPYGCREGICHTCVGELKSGEIRDLRTGKVSGSRGEKVRTCINAPEGPIEIEL